MKIIHIIVQDQYGQNNNIWKHWSDNYLQTLQKGHKWPTDCPNLMIGGAVLIKDDLFSPLTVHNLGTHGNVRIVSVKT